MTPIKHQQKADDEKTIRELQAVFYRHERKLRPERIKRGIAAAKGRKRRQK